jgi:nucleoside 2-deoxyribosyltransferase
MPDTHLPTIAAYIAGYSVFARDALKYAESLKRICLDHGFIGRYPLDTPAPVDQTKKISSSGIMRENIKMIDSCQAVIADLTPFRGVSADCGTIFEVGYAFAKGIPIYAYSNDGRPYLDRCTPRVKIETRYEDSLGYEIENFGLPDNLMPIHALKYFVSLHVREPAGFPPDVLFTLCAQKIKEDFTL